MSPEIFKLLTSKEEKDVSLGVGIVNNHSLEFRRYIIKKLLISSKTKWIDREWVEDGLNTARFFEYKKYYIKGH